MRGTSKTETSRFWEWQAPMRAPEPQNRLCIRFRRSSCNARLARSRQRSASKVRSAACSRLRNKSRPTHRLPNKTRASRARESAALPKSGASLVLALETKIALRIGRQIKRAPRALETAQRLQSQKRHLLSPSEQKSPYALAGK